MKLPQRYDSTCSDGPYEPALSFFDVAIIEQSKLMVRLPSGRFQLLHPLKGPPYMGRRSVVVQWSFRRASISYTVVALARPLIAFLDTLHLRKE